MPRLALHWRILIGILIGALLGTALNRLMYRDLSRGAEGAVVDQLEKSAPDRPATLSADERVEHGKRIEKERQRLFRETWVGGLVDGVARLFLALLKMVVIPLVFASLVTGITGLGDVRRLGRIGGRAVAWYVTSSFLAILTGFTLVQLIRPGEGHAPATIAAAEAPEVPTSAWDVILRMVPENVFAAAARFDLFPIIFFAVLLGAFLLSVEPAKRAPVAGFFEGLFEVMMRITQFVISLAPIGIAALIARLVTLTGPEVFAQLMGYFVVVAAGLLLHAFATLPLLIWALTRRNPYRVMRAMSPALLTALSTASSSATLPLTMERAEKGVGVPRSVTGFVLPLGATVNMDGTALYECVATLFVAQMYAWVHPEFTLTISAQLTIVVLALAVSIGAAGIPHAGLVMMVIVFKAVGLPIELTALLWAVDRPLDMVRTAVNVWSDACASVFVAHGQEEPAPTPPGAGTA